MRQEELAFIKAISNIELSPVFLRELMKAVVARKKKALAATKAKAASATTFKRPSGVGGDSP